VSAEGPSLAPLIVVVLVEIVVLVVAFGNEGDVDKVLSVSECCEGRAHGEVVVVPLQQEALVFLVVVMVGGLKAVVFAGRHFVRILRSLFVYLFISDVRILS